ncbi:MAG: STAS domain-containing protein [Armatimonadetes bacterium]|nr:STAS domain-containing protein [Armatimonadota bacterium]
MQELTVTVLREPGFAVLRTSGYLNHLGAERVEEAYEELVRTGYSCIVFNLAGSPLINSMGWAILLGIIEKNLERRGRLLFCCLTEVNAETMEIMDITQYVELLPTEEQARRRLGGG